MWTPEHRCAADRHGLRYPNDLSNAEWALVEPMIPPARRGGRKRSIDVREVLNAIFYVLWTGCQWKALPKDLPPKSTAHYYFMLWDWDGTLERIHHALYVAVREQAGREASPTVAIIDSQSGKAAQKGALCNLTYVRSLQLRNTQSSSTAKRCAVDICHRCAALFRNVSNRQMITFIRIFLYALLVFAFGTSARAHPHVWVTMRTELLYAPDGSDHRRAPSLGI